MCPREREKDHSTLYIVQSFFYQCFILCYHVHDLSLIVFTFLGNKLSQTSFDSHIEIIDVASHLEISVRHCLLQIEPPAYYAKSTEIFRLAILYFGSTTEVEKTKVITQVYDIFTNISRNSLIVDIICVRERGTHCFK